MDVISYGTHSMRRTKASLLYKKTKNLRVIQIFLGHTKLESTVRYPGIEVDDALELSATIDISITNNSGSMDASCHNAVISNKLDLPNIKSH